MKRFKKELSWLLVAALVVSSLVVGIGQLQASAATQAVGQQAYYRLRIKTTGQDCNGTGTANNLRVTINYTDSTSYSFPDIAGESSPNYFEENSTFDLNIGYGYAKPISSINYNSMGGDRWKTDWSEFYYSYDNGSNWVKIATMGGFDGTGVRTFSYPSDYTLNSAGSALNYLLTFNANGGSGGTEIYSEQGATLPASNIPTVSRTGYTFAGWSPGVPSFGPGANTTYTAQWTVNSYTITWAANGGNGGGSNSCNYGATPTPISAGTRTGYTFAGWTPTIATCTGPATYTATWNLNYWNLTYNAAGGTGGSGPTSTGYGTALTAPTVTRTGYTFTGWSPTVPATMPDAAATYTAQWSLNYWNLTYNANGGTGGSGPTSTGYGTALSAPTVTRTGYTFSGWSPTVPATMPDAAATYTAQWNINSYTVTFDANGGSGGWSQSLVYGSPITPPTVTRTGYTFLGWSPTPPGTVPVGGGTYTAQWSVNSYTITFDEQGGSTVADITQNYGTSVTAPADPTREGYTFTGWTPAVPAAMPEGGATCVAGWTINQYTISFNSNGGSAVGSITQNYGTSVTAPADPTRTGYTFTGWTPACPSTMPASDTTCVAGWSVNSYNITFAANGGTGGTGPTSMQYGAALSAPTVTRTGYTFNYWSPSVPSTVPAGDTTYTAQWTINQYTVSFDSNGGSAVGSITQNYDTQVSEPAAPAKTGNTFAGWYSDAGLTNAVSWPYTLGAANVMFYAKWTTNSYNLTFDANGGTGGTGPTSTPYGAAISAPTVTRTGFTFTGWDPAVAATMPAVDIVYTAQWSVNAYTIYFDEDGGSTVTDITQDYGTSVTAPDDPTKTGYTFLGWDPAVPAAMPASDTYCVAQWSINSYNLTYDANGGTGGTGPTSTEYGSALSAPTVTRTGYTFTGWSPAVAATMPAADTTYTAQWTVISYTITWDADGGTGGGQNSCDYGVMPTAIDAGTKTGYTFAGWAPEVVAATGDATYTAQWTINSYTITWDANGGTGGGQNSCDYGAMPTAIDAGTNAGFTFAGWDPAIAAATGDATYTAQWDAIPTSTITFDLNGGTSAAIDPITLEEGAAVTAPDDPTREGYIFAGWDPEVPATMPVDDVLCVAQWTAATVTITFDANEGVGGWSMDLTIGDPLVAPEVTRYGYTFDGWDPEVPATVPGAAATYTAQWIEIELVAGDGSNTVIDKTGFFIYGLEQSTTLADFEALFVDVLGDGRLEITPVFEDYMGTGTKVELFDNATNELLATYYIVIFGDVSGDGIIDSNDADIIVNFSNFAVEWNTETETYLYKASDLNGDTITDSVDSDIVTNCQNFATWIDQATGIVYDY